MRGIPTTGIVTTALRGSLSTVRSRPDGASSICVQRNSAIVLPSALRVTVASQTCVVPPRCTGRAAQLIVPSRAVDRKLHLSSTVVKFAMPSGRCAMQP